MCISSHIVQAYPPVISDMSSPDFPDKQRCEGAVVVLSPCYPEGFSESSISRVRDTGCQVGFKSRGIGPGLLGSFYQLGLASAVVFLVEETFVHRLETLSNSRHRLFG